MRPSIRRRLLTILMAIITLMWVITSISSYRDSQHEVKELFDSQLTQTARTLITLVSHELNEVREGKNASQIESIPQALDELLGHEYETKVAFQVWLIEDQQVVLHSKSAPKKPFSTDVLGFSSIKLNQNQWRVYSLNDPTGLFRVQVAEDYAIRDELVDSITLRIITPMLITLPLLTAMLWFGINRGLIPLTRLASAVTHRQSGNLTPLNESETPEETLPLVNALNRLFQRLERSFKNERRFTADASHELRTPLAAIKTQAQVAQRATTEDEQQHALHNIIDGIDRMTRLVEQLLTLSRADSLISSKVEADLVDLQLIAQKVLADEAPRAIERSIELALLCDEDGRNLLPGSATALSSLLRNLIDNAIRYTPHGGEVTITIKRTATEIVLTVDDSGPGIAAEDRTTLLKRFKRGHHNETPGSGLGLSIVERFSHLHGATLQLKDGPGGRGLSVQLSFPVA